MFRPLELSDKELFKKYASRENSCATETSFFFTYTWRHKYMSEICATENALFVTHDIGGESCVKAIGVLDWAVALKDLKELFPITTLRYLTEEDVRRLRELDNPPLVEEDRSNADYLYLSREMDLLAGKKFHSKRNFCTRFEREGDWRYERIDENNMADVWEFQDSWCRKNECATVQTLQEENTSIALALYNFKALDAHGGLLRRNGKVIAFTIGSKTTENCMHIHIEKADHEITGAYPMIFREFVRNECADVEIINREDDMGLDNLRTAKLSYHPTDILMKYTAKLR